MGVFCKNFKWIIRYLFLGIINVFVGCSLNSKDNNKRILVELYSDSLEVWINQSKNKLVDIEERKIVLAKAYNYIEKEVKDSIKNKNLLRIAFQAYKLDDSLLFRKANYEAYILFLKINDTLALAETHWNYGAFFVKEEMMDSAYYHYNIANKYYKNIQHNYYSGKMLYNMAFIQGRIKNYTRSETLTFQAISKFRPLKKKLNLYRCYNHLGIIYKEQKEYNDAIFYHTKALKYLVKVKKKKTYKESSLNNLSLVYQDLGNHIAAIGNLKEALAKDSLKINNINLYSKLIDNLAYNKLLNGDTTNLPDEFYSSLKIRDSLNNISGIIISKLHLAEFYAIYNDTLKAISNAKEANKLGIVINNNRDKLASLKLLSKIDKTNTDKYLNEYISLNDSLQKEELNIRNKFARIRFETEEYKEKAERLSEQKMWILLSSFFSLSIFSLLYYIKIQKTRHKELAFEREQQLANEEIYSLILKQRTKSEEGQLKERNRISEELHDGILGKLFGIRMELGFLDIKGDDNTLLIYKSHIKDIQQIEKEIRTISHELKNEELFSKLDFITSIKDLVSNQSEIGNFQYNITIDDTIYWKEVDAKIKINLYRIIQETLQNINKYAKAIKVDLDFSLIDKMLKFTIKDDGIGFNVEKKIKGIGLKNVQSRTQKLNGNFTINSIINNGTIITIIIPV